MPPRLSSLSQLLVLVLPLAARAAPITYTVDRTSDDGRMTLAGTLTLDGFQDGVTCNSLCQANVYGATYSWSLTFTYDDAQIVTITPADSTLFFGQLAFSVTPQGLAFCWTCDYTAYTTPSFQIRSVAPVPASWTLAPRNYFGEPSHGSETLRAQDFVGQIDQGTFGTGPFAVTVPEPSTALLLALGLLTLPRARRRGERRRPRS